jgi:hypothetical protein
MSRMGDGTNWWKVESLWLELFVLVNLACLAPDIYLAHSTNSFRRPEEYIPLAFSLGAPPILLIALLALRSSAVAWRYLGFLVGWLSVAIGVAGLIYHLQSHFFQEETLKNLVYSAPFVAPLAYTGVGLLLVMNRMVDPKSIEWPQWVLLLALGGFVGNFVLSLGDHAQNGFFHKTEWIPVASSAFAIGFLTIPFLLPVRRSYLAACVPIMVIQAFVGILGFYYHYAANLTAPGDSILGRFVYGAPPFAPLLFPNLVLLAAIGLWALRRHVPLDPAPVTDNERENKQSGSI